MRRRVVCGVAAVAALLASAGCGGAGRRAHAESSPVQPPPPHHTPVVMFLGDSYTTGRYDQIPELTYAADTARTLGWQVIIGGYRGTGFIAKGPVHKNFASLFTEQLAWRPAPDMVIVSGGHNDRAYPPEDVAENARQLLTTIQRTWTGGTKVVLMGPMWGGDPISSVKEIRDALTGVASEQHVPFIDPLREHWITGDRVQGTGNAPMYILHDGIHPSTAGAGYISTKLVADLRKLKLTKP